MKSIRTSLLKTGAIFFATLISSGVTDQAFAETQIKNHDGLKTSATAKIKEWSKHSEIKVEVDLIGGLAASAYSIGPFKAEPLKVGGKEFEAEKPFGLGGFNLIDRSNKGVFTEHPKYGVRVTIEYKVPKGTNSVGTVKGSVKVIAGGTEKEVALKELLTRPEAVIDDPLLTARGLEVDFKRKKTSETGLQFEVSMVRKAKGFVRLELVGANDKPLEGVGSGNYLKGGKMVYLVTAKQDAAKTATLKLLFRDGATEVDLPFAVEVKN